MERCRIFTGYDVIDNDHFARGSDAARRDADGARRSLGLPNESLIPARHSPSRRGSPRRSRSVRHT